MTHILETFVMGMTLRIRILHTIIRKLSYLNCRKNVWVFFSVRRICAHNKKAA